MKIEMIQIRVDKKDKELIIKAGVKESYSSISEFIRRTMIQEAIKILNKK